MNINTDNNISMNNETSYEKKYTTSETETNDSFKDFLNTNNLMLNGDDQNLLYNMLSVYEMPYNLANSVDMAQNIQNIKSAFNFDTMTISKEDSLFFAQMFDDNKVNYVSATPQGFITSLNDAQNVEKTQEVSKTLLDLIEKSHKTNQPVRLDFDNNISVILKVDRSGKLTAEFLPSDAVAEQYLRSNISYLRQNLDSQNIEYNDIYYRKFRDNNKNKNDQKQGEDDE